MLFKRREHIDEKSRGTKSFTIFLRALKLSIVCLVSVPIVANAASVSGPQTITLDGKLTDASGTNPLLDSSVVIDVKILNPAATCILYDEHQTVDTTTTEGRFTFLVGSITGASKRAVGVDPGNPMVTVFSNQAAIAGSSCTYTPSSGDTRLMRVTVSPSTTGTVEQLSPDTLIDSVPFALMAESLQGLDRDHVLAVDSTTTLNQANVSNIFSSANYAQLLMLLSGTSGSYVNVPASGGAKIPTVATAPSAPSAGQIWFSSSANAFQYYNGSSVQTIGTSGAGISSLSVGSNLTANGTAGGTLSAPGTIDIVNSGVTAGPYPKVTVNSKGLVTYGTGLSESDIPTLTSPGKVSGSAITTGTIGGTTSFYSSGNVTTPMVSSGIDLTRQIQLFDPAAGSTHKITISAPTLTSDYTMVFPATSGSFGYALTTDGSGNLSWANVASNTLPSLAAGKIWVGNSSSAAIAVTPYGDVQLSIAGSATVTGLQGYPVSSSSPTLVGQILRWNGTAWMPNSVAMSDLRSTVTGTSALTSCTAAQALVFNSVTDSLLCSNITIANSQITWGSTGANLVFAGPSSGGAAAPTFRTLTAADFPPGSASQWSTISTTINYLAGFVGVGTATPQAVLDVYGTGSSSAMLVPRDTTLARPTGVNGMLRYNTVSNAMETYANGSWSSVATGASGASQWTSGSGLIYYGSGNVGIGTATPATKLHVIGDYLTNGKISIGSSAYADFNILSNGTIYQNGGDPFTKIQSGGSGNPRILLQTNGPSAAATDANHEIGRIDYGGYSGSSWYDQTASIKAISESAFTTSSAPTAITFSTTQSSSNSVLERARITGSGNFGIGTASPQAVLDIYGTGNQSALIVPRDTSGNRPVSPVNGMIRYATDLARLETYSSGAWTGLATGSSGTGSSQWTTSGSNIYYGGTGNVGIGTTAPKDTLDIRGNLKIGASSSSGILAFGDTSDSANNGGLYVGRDLDSVSALTVGGYYGIYFHTNDLPSGPQTARMMINTQGNVGIGTTSPSSLLHTSESVAKTSSYTGVLHNIANTSSTANKNKIGLDIESIGAWSGAGATNTGLVVYASGGTNNYAATFNGGSVGVGTTSPQAILDVNGSGTAQSAMIVPRDSTAMRPTGINGMLRYNITSGKLETFASSAWQTLDTSSGSSGAFVNGGNAFAGSATLGTTDANSMALITANSPRLTITSSGNVGIGTATPGSTLSVNGSATITNTLAADASSLIIDASGSGQNSSTAFGVKVPSTGAQKAFSLFKGTDTFAWASFEYNIGGTGLAGLSFGPGGGVTRDTTVYRSGAGQLRTSGNLIVDGNVGIGTTAPTVALHVVDGSVPERGLMVDTFGSNNIAVNFIGRRARNTSGAPAASQSGDRLATFGATGHTGSSFLNDGYNYPGMWIFATQNWNAGAAGTGIGFYTIANNTTSSTEKVRIDNSGNVGVGTTSPLALLDVSGSGATSAIVVPRATIAQRPTIPVNGMIRYQIDNQTLEAFTNGSWSSITGTGGGTASVANGGTGLTSGTAGGIPYFATSTTMASSSALAQNGIVIGGGSSSAPSTIAVGTAGYLLTSNGVAAPSMSQLNLATSSALTGILSVGNGGTGTSTGSIIGASGSDLTFSAGGTNQNVLLQPSGAGATILNGSVGVGTTSPQAALDIFGTGGTSAVILPRDTTLARPAGINGMIRYATDTPAVEVFQAGSWQTVQTATQWSIITANIIAVGNGKYMVDTSGGPITITLPTSPTLGMQIEVLDVAGKFNINNLIVGRNGSVIMGLAEDMTVSSRNASFFLVYSNSTYGWRVK